MLRVISKVYKNDLMYDNIWLWFQERLNDLNVLVLYPALAAVFNLDAVPALGFLKDF